MQASSGEGRAAGEDVLVRSFWPVALATLPSVPPSPCPPCRASCPAPPSCLPTLARLHSTLLQHLHGGIRWARLAEPASFSLPYHLAKLQHVVTLELVLNPAMEEVCGWVGWVCGCVCGWVGRRQAGEGEEVEEGVTLFSCMLFLLPACAPASACLHPSATIAAPCLPPFTPGRLSLCRLPAAAQPAAADADRAGAAGAAPHAPPRAAARGSLCHPPGSAWPQPHRHRLVALQAAAGARPLRLWWASGVAVFVVSKGGRGAETTGG